MVVEEINRFLQHHVRDCMSVKGPEDALIHTGSIKGLICSDKGLAGEMSDCNDLICLRS